MRLKVFNMSIFLDVMKEELERNIYKQQAFKNELESLHKGYLSICVIDGKSYVYRKKRVGNKIESEYVGVPNSEEHKKAIIEREQYLELKEAIKKLKEEENRLRRAISDYEKL